ncbi:MAG TPA: TetR/AcrR family transcriptional regulator [Rhizomicrobium sp.]|nr:TetR/AcrR family transcriptional regulator [Rhizomicrobium sp.]
MPRALSTNEISDFRERLCDAAATLFAARGREGFSLRELAAELGVSAMTPYRYFKDKDDILAAVRARAFNRFAELLEAAYETKSDPVSRANAVGQAYLRFAFAEPASYRLMFDLAQPDEAHYPELVRATERARATMTRHVPALVARGIFAGDPELIGHVFWSAIHGAVVLKLAGKLTDECDFDRIIAETFRALSAGFAPR